MSPSAHPPVTAAGSNRPRPWFWIVPALTFVVGLVLGGTVMATTAGGGDDDASAATGRPVATASVPPGTTSQDRTITIPASCERGLERARTALSTVGDAIRALADLNTARLQELLDRLQDAQQEVEGLVQQCRAEATSRN